MNPKIGDFDMLLDAIEMNSLSLTLPRQCQGNSLSRVVNLLSAKLRMNRRMYESISNNISEARQAHVEASIREWQKIQFKKLGLAQKLYLFPKGISQIN
jgi:hypothetical protein